MSDSVLRKRPVSDFTSTPNEIYRDDRLTNAARGLYGFMMSKPEGWSFSAQRIADGSKDGRDSILSQMKLLEECGYLERTREQSGRMVYDLIAPQSGNPDKGIPTVGFSHRGKFRTISKKEFKVNNNITSKEKNIKKESGDAAIVLQNLMNMVGNKHERNKSQDNRWIQEARGAIGRLMAEGVSSKRIIEAISFYQNNDCWMTVQSGKDLERHLIAIEELRKKNATSPRSQAEAAMDTLSLPRNMNPIAPPIVRPKPMEGPDNLSYKML